MDYNEDEELLKAVQKQKELREQNKAHQYSQIR